MISALERRSAVRRNTIRHAERASRASPEDHTIAELAGRLDASTLARYRATAHSS